MLVLFFSVERLTVGNADDRSPADGPYQAVYYSLTTGARMQGENCLGFIRRILSSRRQSARSLAELLIDDCFCIFSACADAIRRRSRRLGLDPVEGCSFPRGP